MNKYLMKIAEWDDNLEEKATIAGGAGLVASAGSNKGIHELTGRHTYYHGTRKETADKIRKEGLKPRGSKGVIDAVESHSKGFAGQNDNLAFATKSHTQARQYADQAEKLHKHGPSFVVDPLKRARSMIEANFGIGKGDVVTIRGPKEHLYKNKVVNPEYANMSDLQKAMMGGDHAVRHALEDTVLTHKGKIGTEYIKGSKNYKGITAGEILEHVKKNPLRAARFGGRIVGGAGVMAVGAHLLKKKEKAVEKQAGDASELINPTYPSGLENKGYVKPMSAQADIKMGRDVRPHKSYLQRALAGKLPGERYLPRFQ